MATKHVLFQILHLDPMGQGVAKQDNAIYFIPKTLPGETVTAKITKSVKGVHFAKVDTIANPSLERTVPTCEHFEQCHGCQYLHTSYENEQKLKLMAAKKILQKITLPAEIHFIPSPQREGQRNRIQLHYDLKQKQLGHINIGHQPTIISVPKCHLPVQAIQNTVQDFYEKNNWLKMVPDNSPTKGHVELYLKENKLQITWNAPYGHGGFTQVNQYINQKIHEWINEQTKHLSIHSLLDLFGGNGNLSSNILGGTVAQQVVVDVYPDTKNLIRKFTQFYSMDLYQEKSLATIGQKLAIKQFDLLLIDPPRSGFNFINTWTQKYNPKHLIYISCNPHTLARDLQLMPNYHIHDITIFDMFPGTQHFEVGVYLTKK